MPTTKRSPKGNQIWDGKRWVDPIIPEPEPTEFKAMTPAERKRRQRAKDMGDRPFIAWDGEGAETDEIVCTIEKKGYPDQVVYRQNYVLFGASTGDIISARNSALTAAECLQHILDVGQSNPGAIHVIFGGSYDAVKILESWPTEVLTDVYKGRPGFFDGFRVDYRSGKTFRVSDGEHSVTINDVFSFFGESFVKSVRKYIGDIPELDRIVAGKEARGKFTAAELDSEVRPYMESELLVLVRLCETLRGHLKRIGINGNQWHGPGAIANVLNKSYGIERKMCDASDRTIHGSTNEEFQHALQCSYAGGRFELFRAGYQSSPCWQYDINSAYPYAATFLPDLSGGMWTHRDGPLDLDDVSDFGLYRISLDVGMSLHSDKYGRMPGPLFWRTKQALIYYPHQIVSGWYRGVELRNLDWFEPECYTIHGGYDFTPISSAMPYSWVSGMYQRRLEYKRQGNPTELAVKLALNSIYGKMVQHTGWTPERPVIPRWHQLEWGSFITAFSRAKLYNEAMMPLYLREPTALISVETDAVFSAVELPLESSDALGGWKPTRYDSILYLQNGLYYVDGTKGRAKTRGIEAGNISFESAMAYLETLGDNDRASYLAGSSHRFGAMGQHLGKDTLGQWFDQPREIRLAAVGHEKRYHYSEQCDACPGSFTEGTHSLVPGTQGYSESWPYELPWNKRAESANPFRDQYPEIFEQPTMF